MVAENVTVAQALEKVLKKLQECDAAKKWCSRAVALLSACRPLFVHS